MMKLLVVMAGGRGWGGDSALLDAWRANLSKRCQTFPPSSALCINKDLCIYFSVCLVCAGAPLLPSGLSLVAARGVCSWLPRAGSSSRWLLLLWSTGSRRLGFSSCSVGFSHWGAQASFCGIFLDQGSNWCPLHCKVDS